MKFYFCPRGKGHIWPVPFDHSYEGLITRRGCRLHYPDGFIPYRLPESYDFFARMRQREENELAAQLDANAARKNPKHVTNEHAARMWRDSRRSHGS